MTKLNQNTEETYSADFNKGGDRGEFEVLWFSKTIIPVLPGGSVDLYCDDTGTLWCAVQSLLYHRISCKYNI